jgi:hypothetical protein
VRRRTSVSTIISLIGNVLRYSPTSITQSVFESLPEACWT